MPLVVLLVAGALALWSGQRATDRSEEVRVLVRGLCEDAAAGRDPSALLAKTDPALARLLAERLREAVETGADAIEIIVTAGDTPEAGTVPQEATHTAVIRVNGDDVLGLRVDHAGGSRDIAIIGLWTPTR